MPTNTNPVLGRPAATAAQTATVAAIVAVVAATTATATTATALATAALAATTATAPAQANGLLPPQVATVVTVEAAGGQLQPVIGKKAAAGSRRGSEHSRTGRGSTGGTVVLRHREDDTAGRRQ